MPTFSLLPPLGLLLAAVLRPRGRPPGRPLPPVVRRRRVAPLRLRPGRRVPLVRPQVRRPPVHHRGPLRVRLRGRDLRLVRVQDLVLSGV